MTLELPVPGPWAADLIAAARRLGPVPSYGSPEWHGLADADPRRIAAAVIAAEVARYEAATLATRLRAELDAAAEADRLEAELDDWTPVLTRRQRQDYGTPRPSLEELSNRRGEPARAARARDQRRRIATVPSVLDMLRRMG